MRELPSRRVSLVVTLVAGLVFAVLAAVLVPWHWLPGGHVEAAPAGRVFSADQIARGEHVSGLLRHTGWANLAVGLVAGLLLGLTRAGSWLVRRLPGPWPAKVVLGTLAVSVVGTLAVLPLSWRSQHVEREYGLSRQGWGPWLQDQALSVLVTSAFTAVALVVVAWIARRAPRTWPAWAAGAAVVLTFAGSFVYPVAVEPLFNDFTSMPAGQLRTDILALAKKENVHVSDVLVADASRRTTTLNAYVSGFGSTRRVVVYDTLLTGLPRDQVEVVIAHELGHARHHDVLVGTVLGAAGSAFGIGLLGLLLGSERLLRRSGSSGMADPRAIPLVLALVAVGMLLASPLENTISRAVEARADRSALEATGSTDAFVEMQRNLALRSLADPTPPRLSQFWFGSHPTALQRIGMAEEMARQGR
ncbi:MAG: M48 family metallopeptidase [Nocardioidaceae bacterium]|nr:M48 family metallopeptidase [Nocardioidaceae bacterium]